MIIPDWSTYKNILLMIVWLIEWIRCRHEKTENQTTTIALQGVFKKLSGGGGFKYVFFLGGAHHPLGDQKPLETIDLTDSGGWRRWIIPQSPSLRHASESFFYLCYLGYITYPCIEMTLNNIITYFANNCCFSKANLKTRRNKRTHSFTDKQSHNDTIRLEEDFFNHLKKKKNFFPFSSR